MHWFLQVAFSWSAAAATPGAGPSTLPKQLHKYPNYSVTDENEPYQVLPNMTLDDVKAHCQGDVQCEAFQLPHNCSKPGVTCNASLFDAKVMQNLNSTLKKTRGIDVWVHDQFPTYPALKNMCLKGPQLPIDDCMSFSDATFVCAGYFDNGTQKGCAGFFNTSILNASKCKRGQENFTFKTDFSTITSNCSSSSSPKGEDDSPHAVQLKFRIEPQHIFDGGKIFTKWGNYSEIAKLCDDDRECRGYQWLCPGQDACFCPQGNLTCGATFPTENITFLVSLGDVPSAMDHITRNTSLNTFVKQAQQHRPLTRVLV